MHIFTVSFFFIQRWAHAYRDATFHRAVDTNNGTEALNKARKYSYLPRRRSLTLSQVAALLIEEFLPDAFQKYLFQNFKQTAFNRVYNDFVPSHLQGRPRQVILHCLDRKSSSHKFQEDDIATVSGKAGEFTVQGKKESTQLTLEHQLECHHPPGQNINFLANTFLQCSNTKENGLGMIFPMSTCVNPTSVPILKH